MRAGLPPWRPTQRAVWCVRADTVPAPLLQLPAPGCNSAALLAVLVTCHESYRGLISSQGVSYRAWQGVWGDGEGAAHRLPAAGRAAAGRGGHAPGVSQLGRHATWLGLPVFWSQQAASCPPSQPADRAQPSPAQPRGKPHYGPATFDPALHSDSEQAQRVRGRQAGRRAGGASPVPFRPSTMPTPRTWPRAPRASTSTALKPAQRRGAGERQRESLGGATWGSALPACAGPSHTSSWHTMGGGGGEDCQLQHALRAAGEKQGAASQLGVCEPAAGAHRRGHPT